MEVLIRVLPWLMGGLILVVALAALRKPLRWVAGLVARTGAGLALLAVLGQVGGFLGLSLGVNLPNALVLGVLGAPGFGLLLLLNWAL